MRARNYLISLVLGATLGACTESNPTALWDAGLDGPGKDGRPHPTGDGPSSSELPVRDVAIGPGSDLSGDATLPSLPDGSSSDLTRSDARPDAFSCAPLAFLACNTQTQLLLCNSSGAGVVIVECSPYLCNATYGRCAQCDPQSPSVCLNNDLLICTAEGLLIKTPCPYGCANNACESCTESTYFLDWDNDGFGNPSRTVKSCAPPAGYVANGLDCDDLDPLAHPGQTGYYNTPTKGTGSYDYNCNSVDEPEFPSVINCLVVGQSCQGDGWVGAIPLCGAIGTWGKCNKQGGQPPGCSITTSNKIQSCR
jgi:hypothetical protein